MKKILMVLALAATGSVMAADSSSGCGMGYQIAPKQSLVSSTTRSLVNATFSNTIAMTLGTSGCAKHSIVKNDSKGIHFAEANMDQLVVEMSRGTGEFVEGFAVVFGCQDSSNFGRMLQNKYEILLPNSKVSGVELYNNIAGEIKNNATLASSCSLI